MTNCNKRMLSTFILPSFNQPDVFEDLALGRSANVYLLMPVIQQSSTKREKLDASDAFSLKNSSRMNYANGMEEERHRMAF